MALTECRSTASPLSPPLPDPTDATAIPTSDTLASARWHHGRNVPPPGPRVSAVWTWRSWLANPSRGKSPRRDCFAYHGRESAGRLFPELTASGQRGITIDKLRVEWRLDGAQASPDPVPVPANEPNHQLAGNGQGDPGLPDGSTEAGHPATTDLPKLP